MTAPLIVLGLPGAWGMYRHADSDMKQLSISLVARIQEGIGVELNRVAEMSHEQRRDYIARDIQALAERGDHVMFTDDSEDLFGGLLRILAVLAAQPGGVIFAGHLWCHYDARRAA